VARSGLVVLGPKHVALGDSVVSLGRTGVPLLTALDRGRVPVRVVKRRLWNDAGAPAARLRQAALRVNAKLKALGWRWRVRLDAGDVLLMPEPVLSCA
jgi:hypothetical protein